MCPCKVRVFFCVRMQSCHCVFTTRASVRGFAVFGREGTTRDLGSRRLPRTYMRTREGARAKVPHAGVFLRNAFGHGF